MVIAGPAECKASADMSNAFTACSLESVVKTDKPDGSTCVHTNTHMHISS
jgi:hypothetical protein